MTTVLIVLLCAGATDAAVCTHHAKGGAGATELGKAVEAACKQSSSFKFLYDLDLPLKVTWLLDSNHRLC